MKPTTQTFQNMNSNLTEIAYILDRSGSMSSLAESAIDGFNCFLGDQLSAPGEANLSLILFDDQYLTPYKRVPILEVPNLTTAIYEPRGTTALLDAIGRTVHELGEKLSQLPEHERPGQVIIAIFTDGYENASTQYTLQAINKLITHQREKYQWQFLFLGANQDAIATASGMGIAAEDAATFEATPQGNRRSSKVVSEAIFEARQNLANPNKTPHQKSQTLNDRYHSED